VNIYILTRLTFFSDHLVTSIESSSSSRVIWFEFNPHTSTIRSHVKISSVATKCLFASKGGPRTVTVFLYLDKVIRQAVLARFEIKVWEDYLYFGWGRCMYFPVTCSVVGISVCTPRTCEFTNVFDESFCSRTVFENKNIKNSLFCRTSCFSITEYFHIACPLNILCKFLIIVIVIYIFLLIFSWK
jgi:hypothetical protein